MKKMKKMITIILLLLLITPVKAKEEVIRKYKYYEVLKEEGPYSQTATEDYPKIDYDNFIYTDYTESENFPEQVEGRQIERVNYYKYKRTKNINYIKIQNKTTTFNIYNIKIDYDGQPINYTIETNNGNDTKLEKRKYLIIKFGKEIDQNKLKLTIESDTSATVNIITGDLSSEQTKQTVDFTNVLEWIGTDATYYVYSDWIEDIYPYELDTSKSRTVISEGTIQKYKYRDKMYKTYREYRNYSPEYMLEAKEPYTIKDENLFVEEIVKKAEPKEIDKSKHKNEKNNSNNSANNEIIDVPNTSINLQIKKVK